MKKILILLLSLFLKLRLSVSGDVISNETIPENCFVSNDHISYSTFNCMGLKEVPDIPDESINIIKITKSHLPVVHFEIKSAQHIKYVNTLILTEDEIQHVTTSLKLFQNLVKLDLSTNNLENVPDDFVLQNEKLTYLDLSWNKFTEIPKLSSNSLKSIDLSYCEISVVRNNLFEHVPNLNHFDLSGNKNLKSIDISTALIFPVNYMFFENIHVDCDCVLKEQINCLKQRNFKILPPTFNEKCGKCRASCPEKCVCEVDEITCTNVDGEVNFDEAAICVSTLNIKESNLGRLNYPIINHPFNYIINVSLESSNIREISSDTFVNVTFLKHLSLRDNKLTSLPVNFVQENIILFSLDLSKNMFSAIPEFYSDSLRVLFINDNNFPTFISNSSAHFPKFKLLPNLRFLLQDITISTKNKEGLSFNGFYIFAAIVVICIWLICYARTKIASPFI